MSGGSFGFARATAHKRSKSIVAFRDESSGLPQSSRDNASMEANSREWIKRASVWTKGAAAKALCKKGAGSRFRASSAGRTGSLDISDEILWRMLIVSGSVSAKAPSAVSVVKFNPANGRKSDALGSWSRWGDEHKYGPAMRP